MIEKSLLIIIVLFLLDIRINLLKNQKKSKSSSIVMDTSALIDGRIIDIVRAGFVHQKIIVPKIVLREMQLIADGRDTHKRERARLGLDVVSELQKLKNVQVKIDGYKENSRALTDDLLIKLAKIRKSALCTTDFNLNKVAVAEGIQVLNVNELAQVLRPKILPSESIEVKIIQKGESHMQGIGYFVDGTMVVVDGASKEIGNTVIATVDRMIQTKAGKMVFAKMEKR